MTDIHDRHCPTSPCVCSVILKVRAEERYTDTGSIPFQDGILLGRHMAAEAIRELAAPLARQTQTHYPGCWQHHPGCALVLAADVAEETE